MCERKQINKKLMKQAKLKKNTAAKLSIKKMLD